MFFSGFGLYYSFHNDCHIGRFYVKRIKRLLIPYVLIAMPFLMYHAMIGDYGIKIFLLKLSTFYFWLMGNDGMWYISVSVLLYLVYPLLHNILKVCGGYLFVIVYILISSIYYFANDYYQVIRIGVEKFPFFMLGMYVGKKSFLKNSFPLYRLAFFSAALGLSYIIQTPDYLAVKESLFRIVGIIICIEALTWLDRFKFIMSCLSWFGKYSLELYILHMMLSSVLLKSEYNPFVTTILIIFLSIILSVPAKKYSTIENKLRGLHY